MIIGITCRMLNAGHPAVSAQLEALPVAQPAQPGHLVQLRRRLLAQPHAHQAEPQPRRGKQPRQQRERQLAGAEPLLVAAGLAIKID